MGQHKQALEIYVFKMQDYVKAEEYVYLISSYIHTPPCYPNHKQPFIYVLLFDIILARQTLSRTLNNIQLLQPYLSVRRPGSLAPGFAQW